MMDTIRHTGEIVKWVANKAFGFCAYGNGDEIFVHIKDVRPIVGVPLTGLAVGDRISFEPAKDKAGRSFASNVVLLD